MTVGLNHGAHGSFMSTADQAPQKERLEPPTRQISGHLKYDENQVRSVNIIKRHPMEARPPQVRYT